MLRLLATLLLSAVALAATGGTYSGGVDLDVTATPTTGDYHVTYTDTVNGVTCTSGPWISTPTTGGTPGDVWSAPAHKTIGFDENGNSVCGGTYRIHRGRLQKKQTDSDGQVRWKTLHKVTTYDDGLAGSTTGYSAADADPQDRSGGEDVGTLP